MTGQIRTRLARMDDLPALREVMARAIDTLQRDFLSAEQIAASRGVMGLDTQLVLDGTYLIAEQDGAMAGCGGWSRRATLHGGDHSAGLRDPTLLEPGRDPARIRAMYTDPAFARRGVARLVLATCETAAAAAGFLIVELMATASGRPLYDAAGYRPVEATAAIVDGIAVPLWRMCKTLG